MKKEIEDEHPDLIWEPSDAKKAKYMVSFGALAIIAWITFLMVVLAPSCPNKSPEYFYAYGKQYMAQNDFVQAQRYFTKAIQTNPRYYDAYAERAKAWEKSDSLYNAIRDYDTLLTFKNLSVDKTGELYFLKATCHYQLTEDTLACHNYKIACDLNYNKACDLIRKRCK